MNILLGVDKTVDIARAACECVCGGDKRGKLRTVSIRDVVHRYNGG
ncbi:MAG: hypothetical protein HFI32_09080 [Lachnospiraceae bacterium]|nr:hypothetical protein [Lachnospiraceae bacterium]